MQHQAICDKYLHAVETSTFVRPESSQQSIQHIWQLTPHTLKSLSRLTVLTARSQKCVRVFPCAHNYRELGMKISKITYNYTKVQVRISQAMQQEDRNFVEVAGFYSN